MCVCVCVCGSKFYLYYEIFLTCRKRTDSKNYALWFPLLSLKKNYKYMSCVFFLVAFFPPYFQGSLPFPVLVMPTHSVYFCNPDPHITLILCVLKLCVNGIRLCRLLQLVTLCFGVSQVDIWSAGSSASTALYEYTMTHSSILQVRDI